MYMFIVFMKSLPPRFAGFLSRFRIVKKLDYFFAVFKVKVRQFTLKPLINFLKEAVIASGICIPAEFTRFRKTAVDHFIIFVRLFPV